MIKKYLFNQHETLMDCDNSIGPIKCIHCNNFYKNQNSLNVHIKNYHLKKTQYKQNI